MGPHPYPTIVRDFQRVIGDEAAAQLTSVESRLPDVVIACVGGGSNAIGLFSRFIGEPSVRLVAVEAAGDGIETGHHAAAMGAGSIGIIHGARTMLLQDRRRPDKEAHSISAGLDYPGVGPQLSALAAEGRLELASLDGHAGTGRPATARPHRGHPAGARAGTRNLRRCRDVRIDSGSLVLLGLSGRGDKDIGHLAEPA